MIRTNLEFFQVATRQGFSSTNLGLVLEIFSGTVPDDSAITNIDNHVGTFALDLIRQDLPEDNERLGIMCFEPNIVAEYEGKSKVILPLSDSVRELFVEAEGTATWFLLYSSNQNTSPELVAKASNIRGYQLLKGTVGDLGSGADIEVPEASVSFDRDFKCGDVAFNLV